MKMPPPVLARFSFFGRSVHRWVVPFAAVAFLATPILFGGYALSGDWMWLAYAFTSNTLAVPFALIAAAFGAIDFRDIPKSHHARRLAWPHAALNVGGLALLLVNLAVHRDHAQAAMNGASEALAGLDVTGALVLSGAAAAGTLVSALLGVTMAHRYKIGVVDHEPLRPPFGPARGTAD
jgi:hypothetical protein